jgi:hypothetical protein
MISAKHLECLKLEPTVINCSHDNLLLFLIIISMLDHYLCNNLLKVQTIAIYHRKFKLEHFLYSVHIMPDCTLGGKSC